MSILYLPSRKNLKFFQKFRIGIHTIVSMCFHFNSELFVRCFIVGNYKCINYTSDLSTGLLTSTSEQSDALEWSILEKKITSGAWTLLSKLQKSHWANLHDISHQGKHFLLVCMYIQIISTIKMSYCKDAKNSSTSFWAWIWCPVCEPDHDQHQPVEKQ